MEPPYAPNMTKNLVEFRVREAHDGVSLDEVVCSDHTEWASAVGYPKSVSREATLKMLERNAAILDWYQADAIRRGPAYVAPLQLDDFEGFGGSDMSVVSRCLSHAAIHFLGESIPVECLMSSEVVNREDNVATPSGLSQIQAIILCLGARQLVDRGSDQGVADALSDAGLGIARRTVNKYARLAGPTIETALTSPLLAPTPRFREGLRRALESLEDRRALTNLVLQMRQANVATPARVRRLQAAHSLTQLLAAAGVLPDALCERFSAATRLRQSEIVARVLSALPELVTVAFTDCEDS